MDTRAVILILMCHQVSLCFSNFAAIVPQHCEGKGICEEVLNYPHEYIEEIVRKLEAQGYRWHNEEFTDGEGTTEQDFVYKDICASDKRMVIPLAAQDEDGKWHFILNRKVDPVQIVHIENCKEETVNRSCGLDVEDVTINVRMGYKSYCRQNWIQRALVGLDENGKLINKYQKTPSCCNCVVTHISHSKETKE